MEGMLTEQETALAEKCIGYAMEAGAQKVRVSLNKSLMDLYGTLNGELDKVSHCLDRSLTFILFADGRYGSFSTNRLAEDEVRNFLKKAVGTVKMLAPDRFRDLADSSRTAKDAITGKEAGLFDPAYAAVTSEERLQAALDAAIFRKHQGEDIVSEEGEYSDSVYDSLLLDSNGLRCRHSETSFEYGVETTVQDAEGSKISSYWWDSSSTRAGLNALMCGEEALRRARAQVNPRPVESGKYTMVVDNENAARLVNPVLKALGGYSIQQKNSFLTGALGKQVFPEWMTLTDRPRTAGAPGARLFDSEGVASQDGFIIEKGVVSKYFLNTYMAGKLGMAPTCEDAARPCLSPCCAPNLSKPETPDLKGIMNAVSEGILVTGFNGGNSNSATGDFSYGVQGFYFKDGKIVHPVREMLITGNLLTLWNNLLMAGDDARPCRSKLIPTLAFRNVDFSA